MLQKLVDIDRRIIFALVAIAVVVSLLLSFRLPIPATPPVRAIYDMINGLPPDAHVLIAFDYDPAAKEELQPMAVALLHHLYSKDHKVIGLTLWPGGTGLAEQALTTIADEYGRKLGEDYVFLGYKPGVASLIINMGENLYTAFPKDFYGNDTRTIPALQGVESLRDMDYVIDLAAGASAEVWIAFGREKYKFPMAVGCTAVIGPDLYPFLDSDQINGLMAGLKGAAEYETLINYKAQAVEGMRPQSVTHALIVFFIIFSNVVFFASGGWRTARGRLGRGGR